jgi:hypothetical protein
MGAGCQARSAHPQLRHTHDVLLLQMGSVPIHDLRAEEFSENWEALASWCARLGSVWTLGFYCCFPSPGVHAWEEGRRVEITLKRPFRGLDSRASASVVSARIERNPVVNDWAREKIVGRAPPAERLRILSSTAGIRPARLVSCVFRPSRPGWCAYRPVRTFRSASKPRRSN